MNVIGIREPGALELVQTLLRQGVTVRIRVSGDSMRPLLHSGELVEVVSLRGKAPCLGDILFISSRQKTPVIHRLIWRRRNRHGGLQLLTKGDACLGVDGFIPAEQVLGRVERIFPADQNALSLHSPLMRLRAALVVSRVLLAHLGRKAKVCRLQDKFLAILFCSVL